MCELKIIARIKTDFPTKFGIPRQSGLVDTVGKIVFEEKYKKSEALRGLEDFSHLWLIWGFSEVDKPEWSPTVRPPRLGGNKRVGVFATRSPYRPNPIGLSSVKILEIKNGEIFVSGADLLDGTPIYDIKPYIPYTDCHTDALGGFSDEVLNDNLKVNIPQEFCAILGEDYDKTVAVLQGDPRPHYQNDPDRIYAFEFSNYHIEFKVKEDLLTVTKITKTGEKSV
ncbi:MAG: tRNA (N6-threonylcarbamoyladenosine(37)-N6)-methyltransferase TrmO [Ruminococcaceae bacterium]|nr:tRNA (N6-threonylcarbamoyladenosine(37)-N6)-methyltransferase TrmO [Oscillospiraceae bacterium]